MQAELCRSREAQPNYHNVVPSHRLLVVVLIENMKKIETSAVLKPADLEAIERVIYRNGDDIATATSRAFERLEEKIIAVEKSILCRLVEIEKELNSKLQTLRLLVEDDSEVVIGEK